MSVAPAATVKAPVFKVWLTVRIPELIVVATGALTYSSMIQVPVPCLSKESELVIDPVTAWLRAC